MSKTQDKIRLRIESAGAGAETVAGWQAERYTLDGAARGAGAELPSLELEPDTVLELELANGTRILVAAEDAERYLGTAVGRGDGKPAEIQVGAALRLSGTHLPAGVARDGLGAWLLKALRVYKSGPAGMTALAAAGTFQDAQLDDHNGLYRCATDAWGLSKVDALPAASEPSLIFIHGTASSTEGSFKGLWANGRYLSRLVAGYGPRIYALEHRSLTDSPVANALDLVRTLPRGARLHLVSHSRGGMVGELLARANRVDLEPFTEAEIDRFLEHAGRLGRQGFEADAKLLRQLNAEMRKRGIRVERFVRVACPARGTTLASGRLDRWASVMLNLLGKGLDAAGKALPGLAPVAKGYDLLQNFLLAVVKQRTDARILPGLEAMMPDSPLVGLLNAPDVKIEPPLHVLAGDFQGDGLLPWLGDCLSEVFYGGETDLVVNTPSMSGGAARAQGIRQKPLSGPEVTHFSYFSRDESALALFDALAGDDSQYTLLDGPSRAVISRGGRDIKRKDDAPICFLLPGIMGSHIQLGSDRIWFDPINMIAGEMARLRVDAQGASADGWMDRNYEMLARHLADSHEVRPFAYDWRLSITDAAGRFGAELDQAMADARARGKPVRIVAHSMGGLVARLALKDRWDQFKAIPGSRLLQLGTPNNGSHSIAAVLMARDDFVQTIERWFDWRNDMSAFLDIVRDFAGVLELLPWPGDNGLACDGHDYFDAGLWQEWHGKDADPNKGKAWRPPRNEPLTAARAAIAELRGAGLDPECTLYVAGHAPTPIAVRVDDGQVEIGWIDQGDGRVPWKTGIPPGVPVWYTDAVHGDLANHEKAFEAYRELIENGNTRLLPRTPAGARGEVSPVFQARSLTSHALYPSADEVLAAATGGARPGRRAAARAEPPATIEVFHGSLACAESPVLIGAYANDSLRGSAKFLDGHLGGQLERTRSLGRYPCQPDDAMVFLNPTVGGKPGGAIVVGLGGLGELLPGNLTRAICNGLLEYVRSHDPCRGADADDADRLAVSALLVGTGFTGLTVEVGTRCLVEAVRRANLALRQAGVPARIGRLTLFEEVEARAIAAVESLGELLRDSRYADAVSFDGRLRGGAGGYCGRCNVSGGQAGMYRVHVVADAGGALRFTVATDRARNVVDVEPSQRQAVDGLIRSATGSTHDQPGLSRALFELLVPNGMKESVADLRTLMMSLDHEAAAYPWELMRETDQAGEPPLAARVELVRQLASSHGRRRVSTVTDQRVFIVGDTLSGMIELAGAQAEARDVAQCFARAGYEVNDLYRASAQQVFDALFNGHYRAMHLAGHGVVEDKKGGRAGMVLGPDKLLLGPAQISKLPRVPEFVFINCCHLGSMAPDARPRWGELAANLATEFIEMGCKAVIAAGWAVDDQAAGVFARAFYEAMFAGTRFGEAVRQARAETHKRHPTSNTWGAFQAYGDERYRFRDTGAATAAGATYVHASQLVADLDMLVARLQGATAAEQGGYYRQQVEAMETAARGPEFQHARIRERLAAAWSELGDMERAIGHYRAALAMEDGGSSLHALEQLANLEIRRGAKLAAESRTREAGEALMQAGLDRLEQLIALGRTAERLSLLGSYWKRHAQLLDARGRRQGIKDSVLAMGKAYWEAAELGHARSGTWDYYPLLNALTGTFLAVAWGEAGPHEGPGADLAGLLQGAVANGRDRFAQERTFFHAGAEIDAALLDALWACYQNRPQACIGDAGVADALAAGYGDLLRRLGSSREQDSVSNQLRFLIAMLPSDDKAKRVKEALRRLAEGIATAAAS